MAVYLIKTGETVKYTPSGADVAAGTPIVLHAATNFIGVAQAAIADGEEGDVSVDSNVYEMIKDNPTDVHAVGAPVDVDVTAGVENVTAAAGGHHVVAKASANGDTTVWVKINVR